MIGRGCQSPVTPPAARSSRATASGLRARAGSSGVFPRKFFVFGVSTPCASSRDQPGHEGGLGREAGAARRPGTVKLITGYGSGASRRRAARRRSVTFEGQRLCAPAGAGTQVRTDRGWVRSRRKRREDETWDGRFTPRSARRECGSVDRAPEPRGRVRCFNSPSSKTQTRSHHP